ncbi:Hok/Gef family protein [Pantoea sp. B65]
MRGDNILHLHIGVTLLLFTWIMPGSLSEISVRQGGTEWVASQASGSRR